MSRLALIVLSLLALLSTPHAHATPASVAFDQFLKQYMVQTPEALQAQRRLSQAERNKVQATDQWKSRIVASENLSFESQDFESGVRPDTNFRTNMIQGQFTQLMPTGTQLELNGQKFIETQNPLYASYDRKYSAKISQDLIKNSFGRSQRAQSQQGEIDYEMAQLEYRQALVNSCEQAFVTYSDAFIQQEIVELLRVQLKDAQKALNISRQLFRDRLINRVDKLTSESDFIDTQIKVQQEEQKLLNIKRQIQAFMESQPSLDFKLSTPSRYLQLSPIQLETKTLSEEILDRRLQGQTFSVDKARSDRWTDLQVGLEVGENYGRLAAVGGTLADFQEQYMRANLTVGFDLINNTENAELKNAIVQQNSIVKEQETLRKTQRTKIQSLLANQELLKQQLLANEKQVSLLKEKMKIAFSQMKRAKLDFQTYLLHRNSYLNQQTQQLNLKKDYWTNQFALQKEFAHHQRTLCEVSS